MRLLDRFRMEMLLAFALALGTTGCRCNETLFSVQRTQNYLSRNFDRYQAALGRARRWLDGLQVDPVHLEQIGLKGKKKLVEILDAYYRLWLVAGEGERATLVDRIRQVVAVTYRPEYHDMLTIEDKPFKQNATSYLRCALLMERLGLDTTLYRKEIRRIHPRLNQQMKIRGPHQRLAFHWYYRHFGLLEPFPLRDALAGGLIARRADPATFTPDDAYQLTHEIFVPYQFGERLDVDPFHEPEKAYLRRALDRLVRRFIDQRDPDIVAELVACQRYLRFIDLPTYRAGIEFLLGSQNPDGSFGDWKRARQKFGRYAAQGEILHTTMVAIEALTVVFHPTWNRSLLPGYRILWPRSS